AGGRGRRPPGGPARHARRGGGAPAEQGRRRALGPAGPCGPGADGRLPHRRPTAGDRDQPGLRGPEGTGTGGDWVSAGAPPQLSEEDLLVPASRPTLGKRLRSVGRKYPSALSPIAAI